jgi:hypothetical protein
MRKSQILLSLALLACFCTIGFAAGSEDLAKENAQMRQKLNQIDQELQSLKKTYMDQSDETPDLMPKMTWSNLDIQLYGYLKLDAAYDTSRTDNGDYTKWVEPENLNDDDDQFNMTANETRLGAILNGPDNGEVKTSGRVEVDFFGPGDGIAENQGRLMMRHAYIMLDWPDKRFNIIAGQTSDVISPLYPSTVNYSVGWWVGNIGYRRPQIRLTKELGFVDGGCLKLEGAVARTIGRQSVTMTDSGEDAGFPTLQGRASMTFNDTTIGLSGHWGEEEYDTTVTGHSRDFTTWSLNLDYCQPICKKVELKAELYTGENLDAYLGGIGQGVTLSGANQYDEVGSKGGWIAAGLGPWNNKKFNVGILMDDVERSDVNTHSPTNPDGRTLNRCVFGNVYCAVNKQTDVAFELSHWRTTYHGPGDGESLRAQMALIYKF